MYEVIRFFSTVTRLVAETWPEVRRQLSHFHDRIRFDSINIHQPITACGAIRAAGERKIPMVYTCHSLSAEEYISRNAGGGPANRLLFPLNAVARKWTERRVLRSCDRAITLSHYMLEKLRCIHGIPADRVDIVPGGVDLERFCPAVDKAAIRNVLDIPQDRFVVLTVRNLEPRMGLDRLVQARGRKEPILPQSVPDLGRGEQQVF